MGKKKKKTTIYTTVTTQFEIVKLTYLQTLAIAKEMANVNEVETGSAESDIGSFTNFKQSNNFLYGKNGLLGDPLNIFGFGTTTSTSSKSETSGKKIKEQWLQPEFDRIRYAIGIRELTAAAYKFAPKSELVSVPFASPKEIIKAHVIVDEYIPPQFDQSATWIEYYLKPEGDEAWIRVNPLNSPTKFDINGEIVPKIVNFNIPKPTTAQLEDKYNYTADPVKQFRFKAVFSREQGGANDSITPLLKSYRIIMSPKA